jgi:hypothetical protein
VTPFMVIRLYSDAIGREIWLERHRIVQKLAPFLQAKLSFAESGQVIELLSCDVEDCRPCELWDRAQNRYSCC